MNSNYLSEKNLIVILTLFILGSTTTLAGIREVKTDIYLVLIFAFIFSLIWCLIFSNIFKFSQNDSLFKTIELKLGKLITKSIVLLYLIFGFFSATISSSYFITLIRNHDLENTPRLFIFAFFAYLCYKSLHSDYFLISKFSMLVFPLIIIAIFLPTVLSLNLFNFNNLFPMFETNLLEIVKSVFFLSAATFGETLFTFNYMTKRAEKNINVKRVFITSFSISFFIIITIYIRNVLILGSEGLSIFDYPSYQSTSLIKIGEYFQRFEIFATTGMLLNNFIRVSLIIFFIDDALKYVFNIRSKNDFFAPLCMLMMGTGTLFFVLINFNKFTTSLYYWLSIIFSFIIPLLLTSIIKLLSYNKKNNKSLSIK